MIPAPLLWPSRATPSDEQTGIKDLYAHLTGLEYSAQAWEAALVLYETAKRPPPSVSRDVASRWRFIACNECVLELYHLRARLERIQSVQLRKCPSIRAWIDVSKLRSARKKLDDYFPDIEHLRHATAHRGENEAHPEIHAPDGQYALTGFREPDVYSAPYEGKLRQLAITQQSLQLIIEVVAEFFDAFEVAATGLENLGHIE
ncbi:MAG: hypothetical protein Q7K57_03780 [Burkholderiaceae bacterium]|nr:hypothetical protein [Burkholderiaceae bacterium]